MRRPARLRIQQTRYPHWGRYSGIAQYLRHLDPARYAIDIRLASDSDDDLRLRHEGARQWLRRKVQSRGMAWYKLSDLAAELSILRAAATNGVELVHFLDGEHTGQYLPEWLGLVPRRRPKLVVSYHQPLELLPELVSPATAARFDAVVLVSPTQRPFFESVLPPERIKVIHHGIDCEFFRPDPAAKDDGVFRCVAAGYWLRDWPTIRAVAERLRDRAGIEFQLVVKHETGLENLPNVRTFQGVDDETLRRIYQQSSALLLPLTGSTANNTVLESLACGLPVLSTRLPAVQDYVGDGTAFLFDPGDVEGFVGAIERLRADPGLQAAMALRARERAERIAWPSIARQYDALYTELLSS